MPLLRAVLGPAYYQPTTGWGPVQALLVTIAAHVLAGPIVFYAVLEFWIATRQATLATTRQDHLVFAFMSPSFWFSVEAVRSALLAGTAWFAARRGGMRAADVLALRKPLCGRRVLALIGVLVAIGLAIQGVINIARYAGVPVKGLYTHLPGGGLLAQMAGWSLAVLSVGILGPISTEFLLRGFLLPALARTRLGFWGAGLLISVLYAAAHIAGFPMSVSPMSVVVGAFFGGLFLVWALGLTGSLWVPIGIHISYNLFSLPWLLVWGPS
jgi:membrane protease YdiL (CAAX protease family)